LNKWLENYYTIFIFDFYKRNIYKKIFREKLAIFMDKIIDLFKKILLFFIAFLINKLFILFFIICKKE
jgi:hypothetical protein